MKTIQSLGFFSLLLTALPHTAHAVSAPSPQAVFNKLKPGLDTTRSLEKAVGSLRTVASNWPSNSFATYQKNYQIPDSIPTSLQTKMQKTVQTGDLATAVQQTTALSNNEQAFIAARLQHIANTFKHMSLPTKVGGYNIQAFESIKTDNLDTVPRIAVCASGGGFRAMIATMGFWKGMQSLGLDNLILMTACLSGSTWFTTPWCIGKEISQLQASYEKYALIPLGTKLYSQIKNNPLVTPQSKPNDHCLFAERSIINNKFSRDFYWSFPYNMVMPYGNLVGHITLASFDDPELIKKQTYGINAYAGQSEDDTQAETENYINNPTSAPYTGPNAIQSRQTVYYSQAADFLMANPDKRPMPLATSITQYEGSWWQTAKTISKNQKSFNGYGWITYTPFNVEMDFYDRNGGRSGARIETQYLGRQFDNIREKPSRWYRLTNAKTIAYGAVNAAPEYTLDYLQGIWGSAFGISIDFILNGSGLQDAVDPESVDTTKQDNTNSSTVMKHVRQAVGGSLKLLKSSFTTLTSLSDFRLLPAVINNFAVFPDSPFSDHKTLVTVDAGIAFNLPFPPLLKPERKIDMIIALDASADVSEGSLAALVGAEKWAAGHGIPFPKIASSTKYTGATKRPFTVFDEFEGNATGPIIFYIPLINTDFSCALDSDAEKATPFSLTNCLKAACSTFNFHYTPEEISALSNHVACGVENMHDDILKTIEQVVNKKNGAVAAAA